MVIVENEILKIQKIAKLLNKFNFNDILTLAPANKDIIIKSLNDLEKNNIIKKISDTEYLYSDIKIKDVPLKKSKQSFIRIPKEAFWINIDVVSKITLIKKDEILNKYEFKKVENLYFINYFSLPEMYQRVYFTKRIDINSICIDLFFSNKDEILIYNQLSDFSKKRVIKLMTLLKIFGSYGGKKLEAVLKEVSNSNFEYNCAYFTFSKYRKNYLKYGIKYLIPKKEIKETKLKQEKNKNKNFKDFNHLSRIFKPRTMWEIEMLIKGFCLKIPVCQMRILINLPGKTIFNFNLYFRQLIYDRQLILLKLCLKKEPKASRYREYNDRKYYFYVFDGIPYISQERLNETYLQDISISKDEYKIIKNINLTIRNHVQKLKLPYNIHYLIAETIWRKDKNNSQLIEDMCILLNIDKSIFESA